MYRSRQGGRRTGRRDAAAGPAFVVEAMEPRRLMSVDLTVSGISLSAGPLDPVGSNPFRIATVSVRNVGTTTVSAPFVVEVFQQDGRAGGERQFRGSAEFTGRLNPGQTGTVLVDFGFTLPDFDRDDNSGYLNASADASDRIPESHEGNNDGGSETVVPFRYDGDLVRDPLHPDYTTARPLPLDAQFRESAIGDELIFAGDVDVYDIPVQFNRDYWVEMRELQGSPALNGYLAVYDANWSRVAESHFDPLRNGSALPGGYIEFTAPSTGTYHVVVTNEENSGVDPRFLTGRVEGSRGAYSIAASERARPNVFVDSVDPSAVEGDPNDLAFIIFRRSREQLHRPLTVNTVFFGAAGPNDFGAAIPNLPSNSITFGPGVETVLIGGQAFDDNINEPTETIEIELRGDGGQRYFVGDPDSAILTLFDNPAGHRPEVNQTLFVFNDLSAQRAVFGFTDDVHESLTLDDFEFTNLTTGATVPSSMLELVWSPSINAAIVRFTGFPDGRLPDADWRLRLKPEGVSLPNGNTLVAGATLEFFTLEADANRDRRVNLADFGILRAHFGTQANATFTRGDFTGDGKVDLADFGVLRRQFGRRL